MGLISEFRKILRHSDLLESMVEHLDVGDAMRSVPHAPQLKRRALVRCMTCESPDECQVWLDEHVSADETPNFCRNHDLMVRLKQMTEAPLPTA